MPNIHQNLKEQKFEEHIEHELVRTHRFRKRNADVDYDKTTTLDRVLLFEFLRTTQAEKMSQLEKIYGDTLELRVMHRIDEEIDKRGVVDVLRKGVEEGPVRLELMFFRPVAALNPDIEKLFRANFFSVMRQVKFSQKTEQSVDVVLFVNGIPIISAELKNELTGQNAFHAIRQYQTDRDPREKLFSFRRCVAHFAMDTSEAYVTTELKEERTFFLPFNKGFENGAGNPPVEGKHKTYYVWEDLWAPEALADLLQSFVHAYEEIKEDRMGKEFKQEVQLFPRYHQWRTVLDLLAAAQSRGAGENYLIQHSAGSGNWLAAQVASRLQPANVSYFAFTATPKHETLERFGEKEPDGRFRPFSLYSMKQAIEEKFILDVLTNYTTYKTYFKLLKKTSQDPTVPRARALSAILRYVGLHKTTLEQKIEIIMAHFEQTVRDLLRGDAKAMIVTNSREAAVRYKLVLDKYLRERNFPYKTLAAFTDSIEIDGVSYTETSINDGISEEHTAREFKKPGYRFLIVAEKYQTGFDEPYLCAMYVDKRLSGVQAVQTLSRLNRKARDKDAVFVLDFVNEVGEIKQAFEPYYTTTIISEGSDINSLNDLRSALFAVYRFGDAALDGFISFIDPDAEEIHEQANAYLDDIARRIVEELPHGSSGDVVAEDEYGEFLSIGNMYIKRYPYLSQVLGYSDVGHEKLYLFLKYLLKKLPRDRKKPLVEILKYIDMDSVRVVRKLKTSVTLSPETGDVHQEELIPGTPPEEMEDQLSKIVKDVNDRWGVDLGPEQQKTLDTIGKELVADEKMQNVVTNNPSMQTVGLWFTKAFEGKIDDHFENDRKLYETLANNKELNTYLEKKMLKYIADKIYALREE